MTYDEYVAEKVNEALKCTKPLVPHDVVMNRMRDLIDAKVK